MNKQKYGILASQAVQNLNIEKVVPAQIRDEIPTLNRMGYMKLDLDYFSKEFIKYVEKIDDIVLELGCAYGFLVKKILEKNKKIIASDLSKEHLDILVKSCLEKELKNLYIYPGKFPDEINFPKNSLGAVFTSRMFHFLRENEIEDGLKKIHSWLKKDGKLFFIVVTPYNIAIKDGCLDKYNIKFKKGDKWPGIIENQWEINPKHKDYVEQYLHVFSDKQLKTLFPEYGFKVEEIKLFDFPNEISSNQKGHVGIIATKQ